MTANVCAYRRHDLATIARLSNLEPTYTYNIPGQGRVFIPYAHMVRYLLQSVQTDPTASVSSDALYAAFQRWMTTQPAPLNEKLPVKIQRADFDRYLNRFVTTLGIVSTRDTTTNAVTAIQGHSLRGTALTGEPLQAAIDALKSLDKSTTPLVKPQHGASADLQLTPDASPDETTLGERAANIVRDIASDLVHPQKRYERGRDHGR